MTNQRLLVDTQNWLMQQKLNKNLRNIYSVFAYIKLWDIPSILSSIKAVIKYNTLINDKWTLDFLWKGYIWYFFLIKTVLCFSFHLCHITHHMHDWNEAWSKLLFNVSHPLSTSWPPQGHAVAPVVISLQIPVRLKLTWISFITWWQ